MLLSNLGNKLSYAIRRILNDVPRLQVPRLSNDGSILGGIMEGRAFATNELITNQAMKEHAEELAKAKAEDEMMRRGLFGNGNKNQTTPQFNIGESISVGSWQPSQLQNSNSFGIDTSGWGNVSGNSIGANTQGLFGTQPQGQVSWNSILGDGKSFNKPSADNPLAQAVEGLGINPNYMSIMSNGLMTPLQQQEFNEKMNLRQWLEWDAKMNGVTDPLIALARYNKFMPIMQKQAELEELRNAYYIMNSDPNDKRFTPEQRLNARTLVEFDKKNPYFIDDHDMNVEKFGWERAMLPYRLKGALMDLENKELGLDLKRQQIENNGLTNLGDYAGLNLEGKTWVRNNNTVDLSKATPQTIAGLNHISDWFFTKTGKPLIVTSGNDSAHDSGKYSHGNGWKVDVSGNGLEDPNIRKQFMDYCRSIGIVPWDEYEHKSENWTGAHVDLTFSGYKGNVNPKRQLNKTTSTVDGSDMSDAFKAVTDSMIRKFAANPSDQLNLVGLVNTLEPYFKEKVNQLGGVDSARKYIRQYMNNVIKTNLGKDEKFNEDYVSTVIDNLEARYTGKMPSGGDKNNPADLKSLKGKSAKKEMDDIDKLTRDQDDRGREAEYYFNGEKVSKDFYETMMKMGANREKNKRKREEEEKQSRDYWKENFGERIYVD